MPPATPRAFVLPGDDVASALLPQAASGQNQKLRLGPGVRQLSSGIVPTVSGTLQKDDRKHAVWVESNTGRYIPSANDLVVATVHHSSSEAFQCSITPHTPHASLPHLAFENVSKKTRPQLAPGALVYARISSAPRDREAELVCHNLSSGKAGGLGELRGGMTFSVSIGMARRLLQGPDGGVAALAELGEKLDGGFEICIGANGVVWVDAGTVKQTLLIGRAIQRCDEDQLTVAEQKKLVKELLREKED